MTTSANVLDLIQAVEQADSPAGLGAAVQALAQARAEAAIPALINVLGYNNPAAAISAVQGLVEWGEVAVPYLLAQLDDYNYGARAYSFRALAAIADPQALEVLLTAAKTDFAPSVRRAAAKGLGCLHWSRLPPDQIASAQALTVETLAQLCQDSDWSIRYAAVVGLQSLARVDLQPDLGRAIFSQLDQLAETDPDLAVQSRARLAQQELGPARPAGALPSFSCAQTPP